MIYAVHRARAEPSLTGDWDGPAWRYAEILAVSSFRPESSPHRPATLAKALFDATSVYAFFRVADGYVRCTNAGFGGRVWDDSCVEWFLQPKEGRGYFNLEINCGGAFTCSYIEGQQGADAGHPPPVLLTADQAASLSVYHSLHGPIDGELPGPLLWSIEVRIPLTVLESYVGPIGDPSGKMWRGNFYKCADKSSHPHWASWNPLGALDFHRPQDFGMLHFGP